MDNRTEGFNGPESSGPLSSVIDFHQSAVKRHSSYIMPRTSFLLRHSSTVLSKLSSLITHTFFALFLFSAVVSAQTKLGLPNYRIFPSSVTQTEVVAVVHPTEPNTVFASANAISFQPQFFVSEGVYTTTDGGTTFFGSDTCSGGPSIAFHGGDPGIAIDKNGTFIMTRNGKIPLYGLYSHRSTDQGRTWSNAKTITTVELERAWLGADNSPASAYYGRVYAAWVRYSPPFPTVFSYTDDGGQNWSEVKQINSPVDRNYGGSIATGKDGTVYLTWAAVAPASPFTEKYTGFAKSTNGGLTWLVTENAFITNGIQGVLANKQNIRVNSNPQLVIDYTGGPRNGWLYVITTQKNTAVAGSDPDIILNRSTDGGATWSAGIRVNQDPLNNGKTQYFPAVVVDDFGGLNVIYYDDRATTSDSAGVLLSRSIDGGNTWTEFEISDMNFKPSPIGGLGQGYQGDNISIVYRDNTLHPMWMDNTNGIYQIRSVKIPLSMVGVEPETPAVTPVAFSLGPAWPNPFSTGSLSGSSTTTVNVDLPASGELKLSLFDSRGSLVREVFSGARSAGTHEFTIDGRDLASGVYLLQAIHSGKRAVQKLVVVK